MFERFTDRASAGPAGTAKDLAIEISAALDIASRDLSEDARKGELAPVIGRDAELRQLVQRLTQRTAKSPLLVCEPGADGAAVVAGLAQLIAAGDVPETLQGKRLRTVRLAALVSALPPDRDARVDLREFDERLANVRRDKESAIDSQDFEKAAALRDREKKLIDERPLLAAKELTAAVTAELRKLGDIIFCADDLRDLTSAGTEGVASERLIFEALLDDSEIQAIAMAVLNRPDEKPEDVADHAKLQPIRVSEPVDSHGIGMLRIALRGIT
jgi:ATP-dependent Clp protease ATP-binding subunit ClpA